MSKIKTAPVITVRCLEIGGSIVVESSHRSGQMIVAMFAALMATHANGGGWNMGEHTRGLLFEDYRTPFAMEKHIDGGRELARAMQTLYYHLSNQYTGVGFNVDVQALIAQQQTRIR